MDLAQYTEFSGSRRASFSNNTTLQHYYTFVIFTGKNMAKFKNWLDIDNILPNSKSNSSLIEVLAYLAYDTVQEVSVIINTSHLSLIHYQRLLKVLCILETNSSYQKHPQFLTLMIPRLMGPRPILSCQLGILQHPSLP